MTKVEYAATISWQVLDDEVYIINEKNKRVYVLDNSAKDFWLAIEKRSLDKICQALCAQYCADADCIRADLHDFIADLDKLELVEVSD
ncbi:PqqD family protein [Roseburia hominis]